MNLEAAAASGKDRALRRANSTQAALRAASTAVRFASARRAAAGVAALPAFRYLDSVALARFTYAGLAPVAQLDRALPSEGRGQGFESLRARQFANCSTATLD
jgi:hypothetical protein